MQIQKQEQKKELEVALYDIQDLWPVALVFIVVSIGIAYGLDVLTDVQADFTSNSVEYNATQDGILAVAKFPEKMGILATVIIAAIVIGVLVKAFMTTTR
jgi:type II secretory pathway component PulF